MIKNFLSKSMMMNAQRRNFAAFVKATQKPLAYPMNGLEPVISQKLMEFHYGKHHVAYINNLNALQEQAAKALESGDTQKYVDLSQGIKFNGGGHFNHEFFWESLCPVSEQTALGGHSALRKAINESFGSMDKFQETFSAKTAAL